MKTFNKSVPAKDLRVDLDFNVRDRDNYDLSIMKEQIMSAGRVVTPLVVRSEDMLVLQGNRRTLAVQEMLKDPSLPKDVFDNIVKLPVVLVEGASEAEINKILFDSGAQKAISRAEIAKAVWRLQKQMLSEREIIGLLYQNLARYTDNTKKAEEASRIQNAVEREKFLSKWLHGTVGNYLMVANQLGEKIKRQLVLTDLKAERNLSEAEKVEVIFSVNRERIAELNRAKEADRKESTWTPEDGGKTFNELVEKYRKVDAGELSGEDKVKAPTKGQLKQLADTFKSPELQAICKRAAGEPTTADYVAMDDELYRQRKIQETLIASLESIKDITDLYTLIVAICYKKPAEVQEALKPFQKA